MRRRIPPTQTVLLVLLLGLAGLGLARLHSISGDIKAVLQIHERKQPMQTAESTVTNTAGITITIKTPRNEGEVVADWMGRHMEAVNAAKDS